jgi:Transposase and inactivated derivatives, IS30 family
MRKRWQRVSKDQMRELWSRWKAGEAVRPIGQSMGLQPDTVYQIVVRRGGLAPRERTRAAWALSLPEREEISRALAAGAGIRGIARELDRAPSTISREIRRHGGRRG